jgi:hypothetical protein
MVIVVDCLGFWGGYLQQLLISQKSMCCSIEAFTGCPAIAAQHEAYMFS